MAAPRFSVLVADRLAEVGVSWLEAQPDVEVSVRPGLDERALQSAVADCHALLVRSAARVTASVLAAAERLRVVGRAGIGIDNIDVAEATARGVAVLNVPDANARTTAEHTLALLFAAARRVTAADRSLRRGEWRRGDFVGRELDGKVLGVLGGGNVGSRVARLADALGLEVLVHDPHLPSDAFRDESIARVGLDELQRRSDFVTVHVPLLPATRGLVDAPFLAALKPGAILVQCSRGGVVDEQALVRALREGPLAAAAVDVFEQEPPPEDHPLFSLDNVVVTPHLGASTTEAQNRASERIARDVVAYLRTGVPRNAVNLVGVDPEAGERLAPWIDLAFRLGALLEALLPDADRLAVLRRGRLAQEDGRVLVRAVLAGYLSPHLDRPVNLVNALELARDRGVEVEERRSDRLRDFASMLTVEAGRSGRRTSVSGVLFGERQPRLVEIEGRRLEAIPEGSVLVVRNRDAPGVVGRVGTLLGDAGVNIRGLHLVPPDVPGEEALLVATVDPPPSAAVLAALGALEDVGRVALARLPGRPGAPP